MELVRQKVKCIYLQGGVFGDAEESDFNFAQGITFAQTFFELCPKEVDMVFSPMEVGQAVEYTPEQVIAEGVYDLRLQYGTEDVGPHVCHSGRGG